LLNAAGRLQSLGPRHPLLTALTDMTHAA
jgi:hypothetical protein